MGCVLIFSFKNVSSSVYYTPFICIILGGYVYFAITVLYYLLFLLSFSILFNFQRISFWIYCFFNHYFYVFLYLFFLLLSFGFAFLLNILVGYQLHLLPSFPSVRSWFDVEAGLPTADCPHEGRLGAAARGARPRPWLLPGCRPRVGSHCCCVAFLTGPSQKESCWGRCGGGAGGVASQRGGGGGGAGAAAAPTCSLWTPSVMQEIT